MKWLQNIALALLNIVFPKDPNIITLENASPEDFTESVSPYALFAYKDPLVSRAIWEIKYRRNTVIAKSFAYHIYDYLLELHSDMLLFDHKPPIIVPTPLSRERQKERGYNQIELILDHLQEIDTSLIYRKDVLQKIRHTSTQTKTKRSKRLENLKNAFAANVVKDHTVIVIDDVTTTGATFKEIQKTLLHAGASDVVCLAIAH